jgi:hypothetical protein
VDCWWNVVIFEVIQNVWIVMVVGYFENVDRDVEKNRKMA